MTILICNYLALVCGIVGTTFGSLGLAERVSNGDELCSFAPGIVAVVLGILVIIANTLALWPHWLMLVLSEGHPHRHRHGSHAPAAHVEHPESTSSDRVESVPEYPKGTNVDRSDKA